MGFQSLLQFNRVFKKLSSGRRLDQLFAKNFLSGKSNFDLGVLSCSTPLPHPCKADISNVVAILQRGIA